MMKENRQTEKLLQDLPKGIVKWYPFSANAKALCVLLARNEKKAVAEALTEAKLSVDTVILEYLQNGVTTQQMITEKYDYIVVVGVLEYADKPEHILQLLYAFLKEEGILLLGTDNRLGIRYFCGDRDPYTERSFDGVEDYARVGSSGAEQSKGRAYSKAELKNALKTAGINDCKFYSVFPNLEDVQHLFAEGYVPKEELANRVMPWYVSPQTVFLEEQKLYKGLVENDLFHVMANSFLIEIRKSDSTMFANANQVTLSLERGREKALCTSVCNNGTVQKKALYEDGNKRIENLYQNNEYLKQRDIPMIDAEVQNGALVMPYITGEIATQYLRKLLLQDKALFLRELDCFWKLILGSSEHALPEEINWDHFEPGWERQRKDNPNIEKWRNIALGSPEERENLGVILKRGYMDLVSINCFHTSEGFVFFDQEEYMENVPAKAILLRTIDFVYGAENKLEKILPKKELLERYKLREFENLFYSFTGEFLWKLRNELRLLEYHNSHRLNMQEIHSNRQRINYSTDEYLRLFVNIFSDLDNKKLFLFGSGNFTKKFLALYGDEYEIAGVLDNNEARWGERINGVEIQSPEVLSKLNPSEYKVIICIKNYVSVLKQVRDFGAVHIGIYDVNMEYPVFSRTVATGSLKQKQRSTDVAERPKPYKVGYIAGVFDMFHIGHLNLFKRAKEQCEYLLVGVVSDEAVRNGKRTSPVISEAERLEIVQSCRYVDETFVLPAGYGDTQDMYRKYHFDVQFSGSDYADDPVWLEKQRFLRKHGAELVFFPYTESTSSTKLKAAIEEKLKK